MSKTIVLPLNPMSGTPEVVAVARMQGQPLAKALLTLLLISSVKAIMRHLLPCKKSMQSSPVVFSFSVQQGSHTGQLSRR